MLTEDRRKAVAALFAEGKKKKEIARLLNLDPKTVRSSLAQDPGYSPAPRKDKITIDTELLRKLYARCDGYIQRVHEILSAEEKIEVGYSTLTRLIHSLGIGQEQNLRCHQVEDLPGREMQQDTSIYKLKMGGTMLKVVCSALYFRYSKTRYVKFYPHFNRFLMKCFFYEALTFWGYAAKKCVIDNTNLAVLHGTGKEAVFNPEMLNFAKQYGFEWQAHSAGHANRKAGEERNFWTIETNFFPGRTFKSTEDLNRQALEWATDLYAKRPLSRTRLIPIELFEKEKLDLIKLPAFIEPPSIAHQREIDQYGYVAFNANYYWIPGKGRGAVTVIEYPGRLKIFPSNHQEPIEYPLPDWGTRNQKFTPKGAKTNPYEPRHIQKSSDGEEKHLRAMDETCAKYLDFVQSGQCDVKQKPHFIRQLYSLSKKLTPELFAATLRRALQYRVAGIERLLTISGFLLQKGHYRTLEITPAQDYEKREAYQAGRFSEERDLDFGNNPTPDKKETEVKMEDKENG